MKTSIIVGLVLLSLWLWLRAWWWKRAANERPDMRWKAMAQELYGRLLIHHEHQSETCNVFFEQNGKPLDFSTDLGEAYQESDMYEKTTSVLWEYRNLAHDLRKEGQ